MWLNIAPRDMPQSDIVAFMEFVMTQFSPTIRLQNKSHFYCEYYSILYRSIPFNSIRNRFYSLAQITSAGFLTFSPSNHLFRAHKWSGLSHGLLDVYGPLDGAAALSFLCSHAGTHQSTPICVACAKAILGSRLESFLLLSS
jgi:hypothetical protein